MFEHLYAIMNVKELLCLTEILMYMFLSLEGVIHSYIFVKHLSFSVLYKMCLLFHSPLSLYTFMHKITRFNNFYMLCKCAQRSVKNFITVTTFMYCFKNPI